MADEGGVGPESGVAFNTALHAASGTEEARALLRKQARLVDLQSADLEREDTVRHWSLRVRHISDVLKLGFELAGAAVGGTWSAQRQFAVARTLERSASERLELARMKAGHG